MGESERSIECKNIMETHNKLNIIAEEMNKSKELKNLCLFNILNSKVKNKLKTVFLHADRIFANIFLSKNEYYRELFMFNISMCNLDEYLNVYLIYIEKFIHVFKENVFSVIKETFHSFSEDKFV